MKILFFIGSLWAGGKERRLIELLKYLKENTDHTLLLVLRRDEIEYSTFYDLKIQYVVLTEQYRKGDKILFFKFYKICKEFKPDIIHTWGSMPAFVTIPSKIFFRIPHLNNQITDAPKKLKKNFTWLLNKLNFKFSTLIISNSIAGINSYKIKTKKSNVIYNGINIDRFKNLPEIKSIQNKYNIKSSHIVIMVASFYFTKNYDLFLDIAKEVILKKRDALFIAIGDGILFEKIKKRAKDEDIQNVLFTGKLNNPEELINISDIGVLFSTDGEGISNSIMEYMALGKPVIANRAGGTNELVSHNLSGYLISNESPTEIATLILELLDNPNRRIDMGNKGKEIIQKRFSINRMGQEYIDIYNSLFQHSNNV
jgi:glycosyltransferase involved in cell wall biosynthesis